MTLTIRRLIYLIFIISFLLIAPILIFYSAGYRYNLKKNKIEPTGILILDSKPSGASIYLNLELQPVVTPTSIKQLRPGNYLVQIKKDNYHSWEKILNVKPNLTTFAQHIILFKKELPIFIENDQTVMPSLSQLRESKNVTGLEESAKRGDKGRISSPEAQPPLLVNQWCSNCRIDWLNQDKILYFNDFEIWTFKLSQNKKELIIRLGSLIDEALWYNEDYIFFLTNNTIKAIELDKRDKRNITDLVRGDEVKNIILNKEKNQLYFKGRIGKQKGWYRLEIL